MTISEFFKKMDIQPKDNNLFYDALTHSSFVNEKRSGNSYQRLEFVGDSLLDMAVARYLYEKEPKLNEGEMTVIRASVVNAKSLANISLELGLDKMMRVGKGAEEVRKNTKVLSDLFESISAAIYLDMGRTVFNDFMKKTIFQKIEEHKGENLKNPKTILQEFLQADSRGTIIYETNKIDSFADNNNFKFKSKVLHDGIVLGVGIGDNSKEAEVKAAENALEKWKGKNETY